MSIVRSLLDTDLYKFTMWQALLHSHPAATGEYEFVCRNKPSFPLAEIVDNVNHELDDLCKLSFTQDELKYLRSLRFIKSDFVDFLSLFKYQRRFIEATAEDGVLKIRAKGPLIHVMGFEIHVLSIVAELYTDRCIRNAETRSYGDITEEDFYSTGMTNLEAKIAKIRAFADENEQFWKIKTLGKSPFEIVDFGLRRRASRRWQEAVVSTLKTALPDIFKGTSNVLLAKEMGLTPMGTMAHEYLQAYQGFGYRLRDFQKMALEGWVQEYRGDLGVALTDVVGMRAFLDDFDLYFAKLFDGLRHDSGDPKEWGRMAIDYYRKIKIDPMTKRLTFSDGLNVDKCIELWKEFSGETQLGFGIGTNLTNDIGIEPLNIVMKLVKCNGQPVAKLSDTPGKTLCNDAVYLNYLAQVFNVGA